MRWLILSGVLALTCTASRSALAAPSNTAMLELQLSAASSYDLAQCKVLVSVTVRNADTRPHAISTYGARPDDPRSTHALGMFTLDLQLAVVRKTGTTIVRQPVALTRPSVPVRSLPWRDPRTLKPGETWTVSVDLYDWIPGRFTDLQPGAYELRATWDSQFTAKPIAFTAIATSSMNPVDCNAKRR